MIETLTGCHNANRKFVLIAQTYLNGAKQPRAMERTKKEQKRAK